MRARFRWYHVVPFVLLVLFATPLLVLSVAEANTSPSGASNPVQPQETPGQSLVLNVGSRASAAAPASEPVSETASSQVEFAQLPLSFVLNAGQSDPRVRFQVHGRGSMIFFTPDETVLALATPPTATIATNPDLEPNRRSDVPEHAGPPAVVRIRLEGANPAPVITGTEQLPGVANYFIGDDPGRWRTELPTYAGVELRAVYPGIDLRYDGAESQLKSTYLVAPGADPSRIRWRYHGAQELRVDAAGNLVITLPPGVSPGPEPGGGRPTPITLVEQAPVAWQEIGGQRVGVTASFTIATDRSVGFVLGPYDTSQPLILDPTLSYSTYLGGGNMDLGYGAGVDSLGQLYVAGRTFSTEFPGPNGTTLTGYGGNGDTFVAKLNTRGTAILWSTYVGGRSFDSAWDLAVDPAGLVSVTGWTSSDNFPKVSPLDDTLGGTYDAFVVRFNTLGALLVSTYLGGSGKDEAHGIADTGSSAYITGYTDAPVLAPSTHIGDGGGLDVFVIKLTWNVATIPPSLNYTTYLGGTGDDRGYDVAVTSAGNATVSGFTGSTDFPTRYPIQGDKANNDAFVARLNPTGSALVYSTYLGGSLNEYGYGVAVDGGNNAYVAGVTDSSDFITTTGALQAARKGLSDAFVAKIIWNGVDYDLHYSTYLGGNDRDAANGIAVDSVGNAYLTGYTRSPDFPLGMLAGVRGYKGGADAFVAKLDRLGGALEFSTYLGGSADDYGNDIRLGGAGNPFVVGETKSTDLTRAPSTPLDSSLGGTDDAFLAKITLEAPPAFPQSIFGLEVGTLYIAETPVTVQNAKAAVQAEKDVSPSWARYSAVRWDLVELDPTESGTYTYTWTALRDAEADWAKLIEAGFTPIVVVRGTPDWAQLRVPYAPPDGSLPQGKTCGPIMRGRLDDFGRFMHALAERYRPLTPGTPDNGRPDIRYWQIWNEPDLSNTGTASGAPMGCWGDAQAYPLYYSNQYFGGEYFGEMLSRVYTETKSVDPAIQVVLGGLAMGCNGLDPDRPCSATDVNHTKFLEGILSYRKQKNVEVFDIVAYHAYAYRSPHRVDWDLATERWDGGTLLGKLNYIRHLLSKYQVRKPILMDEGALICRGGPEGERTPECPTYDNNPDPSILPTSFYTDQANYVTRLYTRSWAAGLIGATWYHFDNTGWWYSGMRGHDTSSLTAGYKALKFLSTRLKGGSFVGQIAGGPAGGSSLTDNRYLEGYRFSVPGQARIYDIYWLNGVSSLNLTLPSDRVAVYTNLGGIIIPAGNSITLSFATPIIIEREG